MERPPSQTKAVDSHQAGVTIDALDNFCDSPDPVVSRVYRLSRRSLVHSPSTPHRAGCAAHSTIHRQTTCGLAPLKTSRLGVSGREAEYWPPFLFFLDVPARDVQGSGDPLTSVSEQQLLKCIE